MLLQRVAVAAVGLPLLALLLVVPEPAFAAVVELILAVAAYEFARAALPESDRAIHVAAAAVVALLAATARTTEVVAVGAFLVPTFVALVLVLRPRPRTVFGESYLGWWLTGVLYVGVLGTHIVLMRDLLDGIDWLLVMLAATFSTDTGAYAVGRLLGRRALAPRISPNKTWEGAAGGLALGAAGAVIAMLVLDPTIRTGAQVLVAVTLPVAAIAGDLLESALKRRLGIKDMSALLPGHGGILDRLDSLLLTGPVLYWIVTWLQT